MSLCDVEICVEDGDQRRLSEVSLQYFFCVCVVRRIETLKNIFDYFSFKFDV